MCLKEIGVIYKIHTKYYVRYLECPNQNLNTSYENIVDGGNVAQRRRKSQFRETMSALLEQKVQIMNQDTIKVTQSNQIYT